MTTIYEVVRHLAAGTAWTEDEVLEAATAMGSGPPADVSVELAAFNALADRTTALEAADAASASSASTLAARIATLEAATSTLAARTSTLEAFNIAHPGL